MKELRLKTNIKCAGCEEKVKPYLDNMDGVKGWSVDLASPDKVLTVQLDGASEDEVIENLKKAGYTGKPD
ncbi:heavy-metal-associated domain-containing protein [Owenweeksia hongkongensis]|uniref:heavy-metal-associated domain-containing protein n=1 Tax=Owenweeksia hongkongensis TaxID=253245 RepID=UPI003A8FFA13